MKSWQKIALAFVVLTVAAVIFMYSRKANAAGVSILSNKINVSPSSGPVLAARKGTGHF